MVRSSFSSRRCYAPPDPHHPPLFLEERILSLQRQATIAVLNDDTINPREKKRSAQEEFEAHSGATPDGDGGGGGGTALSAQDVGNATAQINTQLASLTATMERLVEAVAEQSKRTDEMVKMQAKMWGVPEKHMGRAARGAGIPQARSSGQAPPARRGSYSGAGGGGGAAAPSARSSRGGQHGVAVPAPPMGGKKEKGEGGSSGSYRRKL